MALTAEQVTILNSSFQPTMQFIYFYVNLGLFFSPQTFIEVLHGYISTLSQTYSLSKKGSVYINVNFIII